MAVVLVDQPCAGCVAQEHPQTLVNEPHDTPLRGVVLLCQRLRGQASLQAGASQSGQLSGSSLMLQDCAAYETVKQTQAATSGAFMRAEGVARRNYCFIVTIFLAIMTEECVAMGTPCMPQKAGV